MRKSIVGPSITAPRPPAHSICATFLPSRSADWAIVSAWSTPGASPLVERVKSVPLMWKVLFVVPVTPGHAPLASVFQPAPVLGGAWVSSPLPDAFAPRRRSSRMPGIRPCAAYFSTASWRMPSAANSSTLSLGAAAAPCAAPRWASAPTSGTSPATATAAIASPDPMRHRLPAARPAPVVSTTHAPLSLYYVRT